MNNKEYLTEERYKNNRKKLMTLITIILVTGFIIGGILIYFGIKNIHEVNLSYSEENIAEIQTKLNTEKQKLETKKSELENKIKPIQEEIKNLERVPFTGYDNNYYSRIDKIEELKKSIESDNNDIDFINSVINEIGCSTTKAKTTSYTLDYCKIKEELKNKEDNSGKKFKDEYIYGIMLFTFAFVIIIASSATSFELYLFSKRREITAFTTQGVMPIIKESIDEIAPSIENATEKISKGIKKGKE